MRKIVNSLFYRTSTNAVKTQVWIAVSVHLLVAILKKTDRPRPESLRNSRVFECVDFREYWSSTQKLV